ncbi:Right handed beta helix region [Thermoplasmatales archaeon SCGC AB-540-F20]|nr:Right handed beta helix region [Thermoplasmatales archaeon SCGC AB-540-F20]
MRRIALLMIVVLLMIIIIIISLVYYPDVEIVLTDSPMGYYVANDGDDLNDGLTPDAPWKTIGKINSELNGGCINVGDDIYFNRGDTFTDSDLKLRLGGASLDDWMIIGAYGSGADPIFYGTTNAIDCSADDIGFLKIQDIDIENTSNCGIWIRRNNTNNITISNVDVFNPGSNGIIVSSIDHFIIEDCAVTNGSGAGICIYGANSDTLTKMRNTIARNCTVHNTATDGFTYHRGDGGAKSEIGENHYILNCSANSIAKEQGFDLTSGENYYIKDCSGYDNIDGTFVLGHGITNVTIDNFHSYDEVQEGVVFSESYEVRIRNSIFQGETNGYKLFEVTGTHENLTIYNNDFIFEHNTSRANFDVGSVVNVNCKNNIFWSNVTDAPAYFIVINNGNLTTAHMNFSSNIYWRDGDSDETDRWYIGLANYNFNEWTVQSESYNEKRANASVNVSNDFNLASGSPAIDAGDWLTTTNGSGSGTTINLTDASYFFPGLPTLGVDGDNIFIGDDTNLEVTGVDYVAETIVVNRNITWSDGENVSLLAYTGSGPDIGAREFISDELDIIPSELELAVAGYFVLLYLVLFCFVIITKRVYIHEIDKKINH